MRFTATAATVRLAVLTVTVALIWPALALARAPDRTPPTAPTSLTATAASSSSIRLAWNASTDNVGVTGYLVYRGGSQIAKVGGTTLAFTDTGLSASTTYSYTVKARDAAGNVSAASNVATATTLPPPDGTAPSVPANVSASAVSSSQIQVTWSASTDDPGGSGVASYGVYQDGALVATVPATTTSYTATGLAAATTYGFSVSATDTAGNTSARSATAFATTAAL